MMHGPINIRFPYNLGLHLDLSDKYAKYKLKKRCCPHSPAITVGSSDKFEISDLIFQMHFPPLSWIGKAYN
jgi:hypothetical protein